MDVYNSHLKKIISANDDDRLAIFVGSGVSTSSNTEDLKLPLWPDLIDAMKKELDLEKENDYLKVAQLYFLEFGEVEYYKKLLNFFPENIPPSELHKIIFKIRPQCIITTNWDCILEEAINDLGAQYSVICSDQDLVKSKNLKKVIKMHGDFKNHNIVFKEDDYLKYSINFPLIENYIKSILSTHTVLFIGYSYSDMNLKHIMKWIQSHSDYCPPMYLTTSRYDDAQSRYLDNHGIRTIVLPDITDSISPQIKNLYEDRSKKLALFLEDIEQQRFKNKDELKFLDAAEIISTKLGHLESVDFILLDQIRNSLTNCGFSYTDDSFPILELFKRDGVLTTNYNAYTRIVFEKFIELLVKFDNKKTPKKCKSSICEKCLSAIDKIMKILAKANIKGIILVSHNNGSKSYLPNPYFDENHKLTLATPNNFDLNQSKSLSKLLESAKNDYSLFNYFTAYETTLNIISICRKQKNYTHLLLALFNANTLILKLKYSNKTYKERDKFKTLIPFDLNDEFIQFPKLVIEQQQTLFDFLTLKNVYINAYNKSRELSKLKSTVNSINNGGWSYNNDAEKPSVEHVNLLLFILKNNLIINQDVLSQLMKYYVDISITRQSIKDNVTFNLYELYTCINLLNNKELNDTLAGFKTKESNSGLTLSIKDLDVEWLLNDALTNVLEQYTSANNIFEYPESNLINIIKLLSYIKLSQDQKSHILNEFKKLLSSRNNTINTYEAINLFFAIQHNLYKEDFETDLLIDLIENIINKVVFRNAHGWDIFAITGNKVSNLYGYVDQSKAIYSNEKLITKLLNELNDIEKIEEKVKFSKTLLYSLKNIGNKNIQKQITTFISSLCCDFEGNTEDALTFKLWCFACDFIDTLPQSTITELESYIEGFIDGKIFHSSFYEIYNLVNYLIKEKSVSELIQTRNILTNIIDNFEKRPNISHI